MSTVKLQGNDGKEPFDVNTQVACCSHLIRDMLNMMGHTVEVKNVVVPLPKVSDAILRKVMEWAEHHKDDPEPTDDDENAEGLTDDIISDWDAEYLQVDQDTLNDLVLAADYLVMRGLLHLVCEAMNNKMKGKSCVEIREMFNINSDIPAAMVEQIREENDSF